MSEMWISASALAYLYFAWAWPMREDSLWRKPFKLLRLHYAIRWLSLNHSWRMFEVPIRATNHVEADVTTKRGNLLRWRALTIEDYGRFCSFLRMRHREFQNNLLKPDFRLAREALSYHLARELCREDDPAVQIDLVVLTTEEVPAGTHGAADPPLRRFLINRWRACSGGR